MKDSFWQCNVPLAVVSPDADLKEVAEKLLESEKNLVLVGKEGEEILGYIDSKTIIKWFLMGDERAKVKAGDLAVLILDEHKIELSTEIEGVADKIGKYSNIPLFASEKGIIKGEISLPQILAELVSSSSAEKQMRIDIEHLIEMLLDILPFGILLVSEEGEIKRINELAKKIILEHHIGNKEVGSIIKGDYYEVIKSKMGTYYKVEANSIRDTNYILISFIDISNEYMLLESLKEAQNEVETAFSAMLPDLRIDTRLKSIVEYMDEYDESKVMIKIKDIINEGCYRHVVNMLKLLVDAFKQGLMELPGMDKNVLVEAVILHDIGKVQPNLKIGDIVNPKEAFEQGYLHAFRSASLSKALYNINDKVYYLIKYHHHPENELPDDFPDYLLPMYRFFRLIDGLSAGITRRFSKVTMKINNTRIYVKEKSSFPTYNQEIVIDIYTGSFTSRKL